MSRDRRRRAVAWLLAVAGAFALGALASWLIVSSLALHGSGTGGGSLAAPSQDFTVTGDLVQPGSPGEFEPLDLTVTNPYDDELVVIRLSVAVTSVDAPNATTALPCSTEDFVVRELSSAANLRIPAGESRSLSDAGVAQQHWPQVGMTDTAANQDGCKGATLSLTYAATGRTEK